MSEYLARAPFHRRKGQRSGTCARYRVAGAAGTSDPVWTGGGVDGRGCGAGAAGTGGGAGAVTTGDDGSDRVGLSTRRTRPRSCFRIPKNPERCSSLLM